MTARTLDEELDAVTAALKSTRQQINKFITGTQAYRRTERAVRRHELRAQWVLEQLSLIETTSSLHGISKTHSGAKNGRKRKERTDDEPPARQQPKRRKWEAGHSGSTLDPEPRTGEGSDVVMSNATSTKDAQDTATSENSGGPAQFHSIKRVLAVKIAEAQSVTRV